MPENELKCCISGSYSKFKPEIDQARDEFEANNIKVLAPNKGWILRTKTIVFDRNIGFNPLPGEEHMLVKEIENMFLRNVHVSDFLYVFNCDGYFGNSAGLEIGFAIGNGIPVFLKEKVSKLIDLDPLWKDQIDKLPIATPSEVKSFLFQTGE